MLPHLASNDSAALPSQRLQRLPLEEGIIPHQGMAVTSVTVGGTRAQGAQIRSNNHIDEGRSCLLTQEQLSRGTPRNTWAGELARVQR